MTATATGSHVSVLKQQATQALIGDRNGMYIDATYGRGGHSAQILEALGESAALLAIDRDPAAVSDARERFAADARFSIAHGNYSQIGEFATHWRGQVAGVLFDLGVSSPQLDQAQRGFSFDRDGPLDMRMDPTSGEPLSQWLATVDEQTLATVFREYGEERYARRIARKVVEQYASGSISGTLELAEVIKAAHPRWEKHKHPATRCFQAMRIHINGELDHLRAALEAAVDLLRPGARMVVISFHSLEDRIVKRFFRQESSAPELPRGLPVQQKDLACRLRLVGKATRPDEAEVGANPRARSSIMRVAEKL